MIVEFIGSTAAGKTTLIPKVQLRLAKTIVVTTPFDLIRAPLGLKHNTHSTVKNLVQELASLPFFLASVRRNRKFIAFMLRMLARQANFTIFTINNLRSLERKIGVYELIRRYGRERIILVDEGTVLSAHNIFVYSNASYTPEEIARFANLLPLPDVIVYVRASTESLIERTLQRTDPPREIKSKDPMLIEGCIKRAVTIFEQLIETEEIRDRVLIVDNPDSSDEGRDAAADHIAQCIIEYQPAVELSSAL